MAKSDLNDLLKILYVPLVVASVASSIERGRRIRELLDHPVIDRTQLEPVLTLHLSRYTSTMNGVH